MKQNERKLKPDTQSKKSSRLFWLPPYYVRFLNIVQYIDNSIFAKVSFFKGTLFGLIFENLTHYLQIITVITYKGDARENK